MALLRKSFALLSTLTLILSFSSFALAKAPSVVEDFTATPGDGKVTLNWSPATDDKKVAGYNVYAGLSSVDPDGGFYTYGAVDAGDTTTYTYETLSNDVLYFFAVTAYDDEGTESEFYSEEASAMPTAGVGDDKRAPIVSRVEALTSTLLEVTFSEPVALPTDGSGAFSVESLSSEPLKVLDAYVSSDDKAVVLVVTDEQTADESYTVTASSTVTDLASNPVVSGTSDTGVFKGSALAQTQAPDTSDSNSGPTDFDEDFYIESVEATKENELLISFSQNVGDVDFDSFRIEELDNDLVTVEILAVSVDSEDGSTVIVLTENLEPGVDYVLYADDSVENEDGLSLNDDDDDRRMEFSALNLDLADFIAPEDVTNFLSSIVNETTVHLSWTASLDSDGDLANYLLYKQTDGDGAFGDPVTLVKTLTEYNVSSLVPGMTYTFKLSAIDVNGNESDGVLTTITLPETGPGLLALGGLSLLGAGALRRRRQ